MSEGEGAMTSTWLIRKATLPGTGRTDSGSRPSVLAAAMLSSSAQLTSPTSAASAIRASRVESPRALSPGTAAGVVSGVVVLID